MVKQDLTFFKVKLDSNVDRERLVRIELNQYENMDRAESQLIKIAERVERKESKEGDRTESRERREIESKKGESVLPYIQL